MYQGEMYKRFCHDSSGISRFTAFETPIYKTLKMKLIIVTVLALAAYAATTPVDPKEQVQILRSEFDQQPEGGYVFGFETSDGVQRQEQGEAKEVLDEENKPHTVVIVKGSYSYTDEKGEPHNVNYFADETGFHAESADIPTVPPTRK